MAAQRFKHAWALLEGVHPGGGPGLLGGRWGDTGFQKLSPQKHLTYNDGSNMVVTKV